MSIAKLLNYFKFDYYLNYDKIKRLFKILYKLIGILLLLFVILVLVLSIPFIQTGLGNYATNKLNEEFKTHIFIDRISMQFNGDVELKNVFVQDYKQDTLIHVKELNTSIISVGNLVNGKLTFGDIDIDSLVFNIKTYKGETNTNLDVFVQKFEDDNPNTEKSNFLLSSSDVSINNGVFRLIDENKETPKILEFTNLNANTTNFLINGSDVSTRINTLSFYDSRGLEMKNLMTNFSYTLTDMTFDDLNIKTPNSVLKGRLKFSYVREDFPFFSDKVKVSANFNDSSVLLDELNVFYNEFGKGQTANFNVALSGVLNDLKLANLKLSTSSNTRIYGNIHFKNLFNSKPNNFYMNGDFSNLSSTYQDLKRLLPNVLGANIPSTLERLGKFKITGRTQVTASTVKADISIDTEIGKAESNLTITKINAIDNASYNGHILFHEFDFGQFLNDPKVGLSSMDIDVTGKGFTADKLDTQVKGEVFDIEYNSYKYHDIKVAGNVKNNIFDGNLIASDRNLKMNFLGLVDFSGDINKYDFEANIDYANLNVLNFIKKDSVSIFSSKVKMNMNSSGLDDAVGKISFKNTTYKNQNDTYKFDEMDIVSRFDGDTRYLSIKSPDIIEGELKGTFLFAQIYKLLQNSLGYIYTNYEPFEVNENQIADFNFKIYNKIVEVFVPEIELGKNTFIKGRVESDESKFRLTFKSPQIKLLDYFANNIELQVDNSNPVFNAYVEADSLKTKYYNISKFNLINVTINDTLFMRSEFKGGKRNKDSYNLSFYHTINENKKSVVGFKKSDFTVKGTKWHINEENNIYNKVTFNKALTEFAIEDFIVNHQDEQIKLDGSVANSKNKDISLNFTNVELANITPNIDSVALTGIINGKLNILQTNGNYVPATNIVIDHFKVNDFNLGAFNAAITGNNDLTNFNVDLTIKDDIVKSFWATGNISLLGQESRAAIDLNFDTFNLEPLNPLLQNILSNVRGLVTGNVKVEGSLKRPDINGNLKIDSGGLGIPYLNVDYQFDDTSSISLKEQQFIFDKIQITDTKYGTKGQLSGSMGHNNFSKWNMDLRIGTRNLLVLDTKQTEESLYYGTCYMGGIATIKGPTEKLVINVTGITRPGTIFKIPLSDTESFGDNSYLHFITKEEKEAKRQGKEYTLKEIDGLELDFDLDVTQDAEVEIIIDKDSGHSLRGRGVGGLLIEINTNGKFNMWGDFSVFEGVYNFAYGGLIQKEFIVKPGGSINWDGNPMKADLNIYAVYKTQANPSPLLDNPINRSIPVELQINLAGSLEQLDPIYEFKFPTVNSTIRSELQYRLESPDDVENQALYLISTGSFSRSLSELNFSGTIAERLNGIINGIFATNDSKVDIGLNYEAGQNRPDYQTDDRFGVTFQSQINDWVRVNGKIGVPIGGGTPGATQSVVAGDVEIDFLLNEDGTLTANVFNRENSIRNFGENIGYTQGVGLSYNVEFDTFKELLQKIVKNANKEKNKQEPNVEVQTKSSSSLPDFIKNKTSK
ncbi:MAG: translocation/assembly module TamB domain-containing protein [Aestuariibaculum sp.]